MRNSDNFGSRDDKGHWKPPYPAGFAPIFDRPWKPGNVLKWLFGWGGYLFPMSVFYLALAWVSFRYLQLPLERFGSWDLPAILFLLVRNWALTFAVYGGYHLVLYTWKLHGTNRKFHPRGQQKATRKFLFSNQVLDNMFYTCISGVPIWTAYEVLYFNLAARGRLPLLEFTDKPVWFIAMFLLIPIWRESHFYFVHRLLHWKPLLRAVHSVHHRNPNPGPWSGMSMHPVEHLLYFSQVLIHFIVPAHPLHLLFNTQITGLSPAKGHIGFEGPLFGGWWPTGDYYHYLHHKHVSCNYGTPTIPWDRWLGRYYGGEEKYGTRD